jgi:hypothetical protein
VTRRLELKDREVGEDCMQKYIKEKEAKRRVSRAGSSSSGGKRKLIVCGTRCFEEYPANPDDLPKVEPPKVKPKAKHVGWTHSDAAESWFLEDRNGIHQIVIRILSGFCYLCQQFAYYVLSGIFMTASQIDESLRS